MSRRTADGPIARRQTETKPCSEATMKHLVSMVMLAGCALIACVGDASAVTPPGVEHEDSRVTGPKPAYTAGQGPLPGAVILPSVPADYDWWNGCSPTAAGMIFGWWDEAGVDAFPGDHRNLPATYGNTSTNPAHYEDARGVVAGWAHKQEGVAQSLTYGSYENHPPDSLADFLRTRDGWTYFSSFAHGVETFGAWDDPRTPAIESRRFDATRRMGVNWTYADYCAQIDAGRPVHLGLTGDDGGHSVVGVGYNNTGGKENYILLTTWHWGLQEWEWQNETQSGREYSVSEAVVMHALPDPVPALSAYFSVAHTSIGDLTVRLGVGDPGAPDWVITVWDEDGGTYDNLVLTDIDCTDVLAAFQSSELDWFLEVSDGSASHEGTIEDFQVRYNFDETVFTGGGTSVPVLDHQPAYAYLTTPEPATLVLLAAGGLGLVLARRRP
jgi:hypothetical protein